MTLSASNQRTLDFLRAFQTANGFAPSHEEIKRALGLSSTSSVAYRLDCLEARGLIRRRANKARAIQVVET